MMNKKFESKVIAADDEYNVVKHGWAVLIYHRGDGEYPMALLASHCCEGGGTAVFEKREDAKAWMMDDNAGCCYQGDCAKPPRVVRVRYSPPITATGKD